VTETETPALSWDTSEIFEHEAKYRFEEDNPNNLSEDEIRHGLYDDPDLLTFEWESLCEALTDLMKDINPDGDQWHCEVKNFGWQRRNGYRDFRADTGAKLLQQILPNTDNTFWIYNRGDHIALNNCHHDSPIRGVEWYTVKPAKEDEDREQLSSVQRRTDSESDA